MNNSMDYQIGITDALDKSSWGTYEWTRAETKLDHEITIHAARNSTAAFQLRLFSRQDFVLLVDRANWLHPLGFCPRLRLEVRFPALPEEAIEIFPVGWVEGDDRRLWMETLDRAGYAEVPANRPQAVYVRIHVPASLDPGLYTGQVRVFSQYGFVDESPAWEAKVLLQVAKVILPDPQDWGFHLNLWQHCTSLARYSRVPLWSEAHFAIIERYYACLSKLGQKAVTIIAGEIPWSGQRCYRDQGYPSYLFEHAVVDVERDEEGRLHFDYGNLDRQLELARKHGLDREISIFGLLNIWVDEAYGFGKVAPDAPDAIRVRCYDRPTGAITYLRTAEELKLFIRSLHDHLDGLGLLDRVRIAADEPSDLPVFNERLAFVRQAAPGFKYLVYINHFEFMQDAPADVVDAIPVLPLACRDTGLTAQLADDLHSRGGKLLFYVCCWPPIPNTFLHSPLVESCLIGWLTHGMKLDGFARWAFCLWPADPWRRVSWRAPAFPAGDMFFVMPGNDGAPVETLRYEALRQGIQDFELLRLAEQRLPAEMAQAAIQKAFACILHAPSLGEFANAGTANAASLYSLEAQDYQAARGIILDALDQ